MTTKKHLSAELAEQMQSAVGDATPDQKDYWETLAETARAVLGGKIDEYSDALTRACIRLKHPGSAPETPSKKGTSCPRCRMKVRAYKDCSTLLKPDS